MTIILSMAHASALLALGCELAQGYGVARPMPAAEVMDWIKQWQLRQEWQQLCVQQTPSMG